MTPRRRLDSPPHILVDRTQRHIEDAARIWAEATAARDQDGDTGAAAPAAEITAPPHASRPGVT